MTYWRLHYHLIWSTFERRPALSPKCEVIFYQVLYSKAQELGLKIHAAGNVSDHVHLVISIPPKLAVADCVKHIKGASAHAINQSGTCDGPFRWQVGYGALSIGERSLDVVMAYAANQKQHHREETVIAVYERIDEEK